MCNLTLWAVLSVIYGWYVVEAYKSYKGKH